MKKMGVLLLMIFLIPLISAEQPWSFTANSSSIVTNVTFNISLEKIGNSLRIPSLKFNTTLFPKTNFRQTVLSNIINLDKNITDDWLYYEWMFPEESKTVDILSFIETKDIRRKINTRVKFPLEITKELEQYVKSTPLINSDDAGIRKIASSLAEGEDDLYVVAFKLAVWVNENIKYEITNETANEVKSASWVLENKIGVCDDISGLFIALCRSLKIPARYVSGIAYSNQGKGGFESHGWTEVYFPGMDWAPFDVVYGQMGYIDVSHIEFFKNSDANLSSTTISYKADNAKITLEAAKVKATLKKSFGKVPLKILMEVTPFKEDVGFGSYNFIDLKLTNLKDYYQATEVIFDGSKGIQFIDNPKRFVLLLPNETRHEYFIIMHNLTFTDRFFFTHPLSVRTIDDYEASGVVVTKPNYQTFSLEIISDYVKLKTEERDAKSKEVTRDLKEECTPEAFSTYLGYELKIPCNVENNGNQNIEHLQLCIEQSCQGFELQIGEKKQINLTKVFNETGQKNIIAELTGNNITKSQMISIQVFPEPSLV